MLISNIMNLKCRLDCGVIVCHIIRNLMNGVDISEGCRPVEMRVDIAKIFLNSPKETWDEDAYNETEKLRAISTSSKSFLVSTAEFSRHGMLNINYCF